MRLASQTLLPRVHGWDSGTPPFQSPGSAPEARAPLKETGVKGTVFGQDCAAVNLLHGQNKLRYKHDKGDSIAVKAFQKVKGIILKLFPRYLGNRLHILFHLSGIYFHMQDTVLDLLRNDCSPRRGLTASLVTDLKNPNILQHLLILGLFRKSITGPRRNLLYTETRGTLT